MAAFAFFMALANPGMDLPPRLTRWLEFSEFREYSRTFTEMPFDPIVWSVSYGIVVICALALVIFFLFTVFRAPFIRFDLVTDRHREVAESWTRNGSLASKFFLFSLCVGIVQACVSFVGEKLIDLAHLPAGRISYWLTDCGAGVWTIAGILFYWAVDDFLVPVLSLEGGTVSEAALKSWRLLFPDLLGLLRYLATKALLASLTTLAVAFSFYLQCRLVVAPAARFGIRVLQAQTIRGVTPVNSAAIGVTVLAVLILVLLVLCWSVTAGIVSIFFGNYGVLFLAARYPALNDLLEQRDEMPADRR